MKKKWGAALTCTALAASLSACSGVNAGAGGEEITFATVSGWDDTVAVTALWTALLEDRDYNVDTVAVDLAAGMSAVATGELDGYLNTWLPSTHKAYVEEYRDDLVIFDEPYFDDNRQVLAVPEFVEEDTIKGVVQNAKKYDSRIVGLEAGSGNMKQLPGVVEAYDAKEKLSIIDGSTPAALAALEKATKNNEHVVVSLWQPHWAFAAMPVKALEDPAGGWPAPDGSYVVLSEKFAEEEPQVAEWLSNFKLTEEQYASLMLAVSEAEDAVKGARQWLEKPENKQAAESWFK
ncbi:glycine betaine ABC transporter substrate-binding protein [Arthrobacter pigmenti]